MADGPPQLRLIPGGGEIVGTLEQVLEQAKEGKLVGVVVCGISDEDGGSSGWVWAHRDGIACPWPRLLAITATAFHDLVNEGLVE